MKSDPQPYEARITADPRILGGKPVVRGTCISVGLVLEEHVSWPLGNEPAGSNDISYGK